MISVWFLDECDYVAGETREGVLEWYRKETGVVAEVCMEADLDMKYVLQDEFNAQRALSDPLAKPVAPCTMKTFRSEITDMLERGEAFPAIIAMVDP